MTDPRVIAEGHQPNTPRTHDANGRALNEPVQCAKCLQAWPCDVWRLYDQIKNPSHYASVPWRNLP